MRQEELFPLDKVRTYGGKPNKRKRTRPLHSKKSLHITQRSSRGWSLRSRLQEINQLIRAKATTYGVFLIGIEIMNTHYHLHVKFTTRATLQNFLRTVNGIIARKMLDAQRGKPKGKFWDQIVYTRVVENGPDWLNVVHYFRKNRIESEEGYEGRLAYEFDLSLRKNARAIRRDEIRDGFSAP